MTAGMLGVVDVQAEMLVDGRVAPSGDGIHDIAATHGDAQRLALLTGDPASVALQVGEAAGQLTKQGRGLVAIDH